MMLGFTFQNCTQQQAQDEFCADLNAEDFQTSLNGKETNLYFLSNGNISAAITNYGGRIVSLCVPGKDGEQADVVHGFSSIEDYQNATEVFHGTLIGRLVTGLPVENLYWMGRPIVCHSIMGQIICMEAPEVFIMWYGMLRLLPIRQ